ncbi:MAG: 3-phosphoshikimate 1-carboxyvinyltransferase [Candidatus Shikimatogenerans sp. JK-2022]|nr:3-phosphoshikimate 1-carboxyvinyltransferase [Candidatus Shikimatogenerans bostrichidophilus]
MESIVLNYKYNNIINNNIYITGSKSESNRLLIIKKLFKKKKLKLINLSNSRDTKIMIKSLKNDNKKILNIKDAGTVMRFLISYFSIKKNNKIILIGTKRMNNRPILDLVTALNNLGALIKYKGKIGYPPILIKGKKIINNKIYINSNISSQFLTSIILISYKLKNGLTIYLHNKITSSSYIKMTINILKKLKIDIKKKKKKIIIKYKKNINVKKYIIESDWSSASYYYSIISLLNNNVKLILKYFKKKSLQGDNIIYKIYKKYFGVKTIFKKNKIIIQKTNKKLFFKKIKINLKSTPDIAQTIILTCSELKIKCLLTGLKTLKVKETNRLKALKKELKKIGVITNINNQSIEIIKFKKINKNNIFIKTYNDHRMAMSFSILAIKNKNIIIDNPSTVNKSYPNFWKDLKKIGFLIKKKI